MPKPRVKYEKNNKSLLVMEQELDPSVFKVISFLLEIECVTSPVTYFGVRLSYSGVLI